MVNQQSIFKSPVFIAAVVVNVFGVLYLVVSPETAIILKAIVGAFLAILDVYAAANNATNPQGFGANVPVPDGTLHIDSSNPTKDLYRLEITTDLGELAKKPALSLTVNTEGQKSQE